MNPFAIIFNFYILLFKLFISIITFFWNYFKLFIRTIIEKIINLF